MRPKDVVTRFDPCNSDLTHTHEIVPKVCPNLDSCRSGRETSHCVRREAQQMAVRALREMARGNNFETVIDDEIQSYLDRGPSGKFLAERGGGWTELDDRFQALGDIVELSKNIIGE